MQGATSRNVAAPATTKATAVKSHMMLTILMPTVPRSAEPPSTVVVYGISAGAARRQGIRNPGRWAIP
jgi:hypothetical protein